MDAKVSILNECMLKIMKMSSKKSKCTCQCRDFVFLKAGLLPQTRQRYLMVPIFLQPPFDGFPVCS